MRLLTLIDRFFTFLVDSLCHCGRRLIFDKLCDFTQILLVELLVNHLLSISNYSIELRNCFIHFCKFKMELLDDLSKVETNLTRVFLLTRILVIMVIVPAIRFIWPSNVFRDVSYQLT